MTWIPLLLAAWIVVDVLVVATFAMRGRRRGRLSQAARPALRSRQVSGRPTSRVVH